METEEEGVVWWHVPALACGGAGPGHVSEAPAHVARVRPDQHQGGGGPVTQGVEGARLQTAMACVNLGDESTFEDLKRDRELQ